MRYIVINWKYIAHTNQFQTGIILKQLSRKPNNYSLMTKFKKLCQKTKDPGIL